MKILTRFIDCLDRLFQWILIFLMVEITLVITAAVISRYFFNDPIYWAEEVTRYSFVWATFLGAACAYRRKELVSMSMFINSLPQNLRHWVLLIIESLITLFLVLAVAAGIKMAKVVAPQLAVSTRISLVWLYAVVPVSCSFMFFCALDNILGIIKGRDIL